MPTTYAIPNGRTVMDATLYTGNGSTKTVTNNDTGTQGFYPDLTWIKVRSTGYSHRLVDSVRGATKLIYSDQTLAETTDSNSLTSFNSNGFSLGNAAGTNENAATFVAWQWQAGSGTTSTNNVGSISSTTSVNATAGFSIVTYTGNGVASTVGHGLGAVPSFMIFKDRTSSSWNWQVYHVSLGNTNTMLLNLNDAAANYGSWNSTTPTSSVFSIGGVNGVNTSGNSMVAYCWTPIPGFSAFGSYSGNGSVNGPFIYLGFRPKYVMIKRTDSSAGRWDISDTSRNPYNYVTQWLYANYADAEDNAGELYDFLSNGFKLRNTGSGTNASGGSYIYMAFAENPFKYANAR